MLNRWSDVDAAAYVQKYGDRWGADMALRVYTSHLIGAEASLVMHGGGNTSVKGSVRNVLGDEVEAVFVKGSGWDLSNIEPKGFPAVALDHLRRMCRLEKLSDEDMVNEQRTHMFDASAPNPSIEALLHAYIPHRFVDHSHADAILILTNAATGGEAHVRAALGDDVLIVPYIKPGFDLAALCARALDANPSCTSMVLLQHGLFTWGATAKEAYDHHIELVTRAEHYAERAASGPRPLRPSAHATIEARQRAARIAPLLRGVLGQRGGTWILDHRVNPALLGQLDDPRLDRWVAAGPITPDHVIRTRARAAVVRVDFHGAEADLRAEVQRDIDAWRTAYDAYYHAHVDGRPLKQLDPNPRVILLPGVGMFTVGETVTAAQIAADIGARALEVKEETEALGGFQGLPDRDLFEVEYWSLEQAKLGKAKPPALARKVALITGGAGAIGVGVARRLLDQGCAVVLADRDAEALARAEAALGKRNTLMTLSMDVTQAASVQAAFDRTAETWGGVDIVIPNAGIAHSAPITRLEVSDFERVMDVNAHGVFLTVRAAARHLIAQGTGGHIVIISSKNVFAPGEEFAAYSASKAAAHQIGRVAALELAPHQIRVNMVNPDAVFAQDGIPSGLWEAVGPDRARARGLTADQLPDFYRQRNLLKAEITGEHVGNAVVFFVTNQTPTTGASLPVDGGVAGAFPR